MAKDSVRPDEGFRTTNWLLVRKANGEESHACQDALGELLTRYRPALLSHLVHGKKWELHRAEDLLQSFFLDKILQGTLLAAADPAKGKLRTLLVTALDRYAISFVRQEKAKKRSPDRSQSLDTEGMAGACAASGPSSSTFEVAWGMQVLAGTLTRMQDECGAKQWPELWGVFEGRTLAPIRGAEPVPFEQLQAQFGFRSVKQVQNTLTTAERMFRRHLRLVIAEYCSEDGVEEEIADLIRILSQAGAELVEGLRITQWDSVPGVTVSRNAMPRIDPHALSRILKLARDEAQDQGALLARLLTAQELFDLLDVNGELARKLSTMSPLDIRSLRSFADLFQHSQPPTVLLELTKQFAKDSRTDPDSPLPRPVATVLYYASIAVALARGQQRISKHDDEGLRKGFQWAIDQPWVDEGTRSLFREGLKCL